MADETNHLLKRLTLTDAEGEEVSFGIKDEFSVQLGSENWAVGKLITDGAFNRDALVRVFKNVWYTDDEVTFIYLNSNTLLVKFGSKEDKKKIMDLEPWSFDKMLFVLKDYEPSFSPRDYDFSLVPFWIRFYNLPLGWVNRLAALMLGGAVGEVMAIDWRDREGGWGEYIRVRVWLDITKPLRRVVKMGSQTGPLKVAMVKYERLPNFCYGCELIGHSVEACKTVKLTEGMEEADLQFGEWLRVPLPKRPRQRPSKTGKSASHRGIEVVEGAKGDGSSSSKGPANGTRVNALKFEVGVESQVKSDDKGSSSFEGTEPPSCNANDALKQQVKGKGADDGTQGLKFRGIPKLNPSKLSSGDF
ncbi:hypothetical protein Goshw_017260 [Gossypium schwendimanii]|uniref:DUF4283 domain-containing protein n=1 Tax=Gossypium schwendimanii TaxID=34291 RepID=A0A7J9LNH4_GOSSC|nr:hypothetical protein [Gossypium schwendimanii]